MKLSEIKNYDILWRMSIQEIEELYNTEVFYSSEGEALAIIDGKKYELFDEETNGHLAKVIWLFPFETHQPSVYVGTGCKTEFVSHKALRLPTYEEYRKYSHLLEVNIDVFSEVNAKSKCNGLKKAILSGEF